MLILKFNIGITELLKKRKHVQIQFSVSCGYCNLDYFFEKIYSFNMAMSFVMVVLLPREEKNDRVVCAGGEDGVLQEIL